MDDLAQPFPKAHELLDRVMDICPFPATAQRLMTLVNDESAPLEATATAVACDPALATQVLRVANSAAFRSMSTEPLRDLRQALVRIGLEELRTMAGAMALLAAFATRDELSLDLHRTSTVSGSIAAAIAPPVAGGARSLSFICGLLCEVGALACLVVDGPAYVELWRRTVGSGGRWSLQAALTRDNMETKRYGTTARTIGARLLRRHRLPEEIATAIEADPQQPPTASIVHRATAFARLITPVLVMGFKDAPDLADQAADIAQLTSITELDTPELVRRSVSAAIHAERALRSTRG